MSNQLKLYSPGNGGDLEANQLRVFCWDAADGWASVSSSKIQVGVDHSHLAGFVEKLAEQGKLVLLLPADGSLPDGWAEFVADMNPELRVHTVNRHEKK